MESHLYCSRITIQRDLVELGNKGLLNRVNGGDMLKNFDLANYSHDKRLLIQSDKKKKIAKKAMEFVEDGDCIFIDNSTYRDQGLCQ